MTPQIDIPASVSTQMASVMARISRASSILSCRSAPPVRVSMARADLKAAQEEIATLIKDAGRVQLAVVRKETAA